MRRILIIKKSIVVVRVEQYLEKEQVFILILLNVLIAVVEATG